MAVHAHPPCMGRGVCGQHSVAVHAHPPCHGRGHVIRHHMVITIHHHSAKLITCAPAFHYSRPSTAGAGTGIRMWLAGGAGVMQPWGEEANLRGTVSLGGTSMAARRHRGTKVEVAGCGQLTNNSIGLPWICSYIVVLISQVSVCLKRTWGELGVVVWVKLDLPHHGVDHFHRDLNNKEDHTGHNTRVLEANVGAHSSGIIVWFGSSP